MNIQEWEIWHTYTTFLEGAILPLDEAANALIEADIASCVVLDDGRTYWRAGDIAATGFTAPDPNVEGGLQLVADDPKNQAPEGFALEAWGQAVRFLQARDVVLGPSGRLIPEHLRAHLGKVVLQRTKGTGEHLEVFLYPTLVVYITGVLILEFRVICPPTPIDLRTFIDQAVNLYQHEFDKVRVRPGLSSFATRAYYAITTRPRFLGRVKLFWQQMGHEIAIKQQTNVQEDEDFSFELAPLSIVEPESLRSLAISMFYVFSFVLSRRSSTLQFILLGQKPLLNIGEYWSGRPYIYLVKFEGQAAMATANEKTHGANFSRILARSIDFDSERARRDLPDNARMFEDYGAYIGSACGLFVWSADGVASRRPKPDPNRGDLIYQRQLVAETLEYGYMLYRSLYHRAERLRSASEVEAVRKELLKLRLTTSEASQSGEIRELLAEGWSRFGLPDLIADTKEILALQEETKRARESRRATRVGWALTSVFGFLAVPTLADQVIEPFWKLHPLFRSPDILVAKLESNGIAAAVVILVTLIIFALASRQ